MIDTITHNNTVLATIVYKNERTDGIKFITPNDYPLQLGLMNHPKNHKIKPHIHNTIKRETVGTYEVLFIRKGKIKINFYDFNQEYLETRILNEGDLVLLVGAGHGITILEETELIEVKNGPYYQEMDKDRFNEPEGI